MIYIVIQAHRMRGYDFYEWNGWHYTILGAAENESAAVKIAAEKRDWPEYADEVYVSVELLTTAGISLDTIVNSLFKEILQTALKTAFDQWKEDGGRA